VKAKTPFAWVASACAKPTDLRRYLGYVMSDGLNIVATDGARMHVFPDTSLAPGLYDPKTGLRVWGLYENYAVGDLPGAHPGKFPDWRRVIPAPGARSSSEIPELRVSRLGKEQVVSPGSSWFVARYWEAAASRCSSLIEGTPHVGSTLLTGDAGEQAVLMPLRQVALEKAGII